MSDIEGMVAVVRGKLYRHQGGKWEEVGSDGDPTGDCLPGPFETALFGDAERDTEVEREVGVSVAKLGPYVPGSPLGVLSSSGSGGPAYFKSVPIVTSTACPPTRAYFIPRGAVAPLTISSTPASTTYILPLSYGTTSIGTYGAVTRSPYPIWSSRAGEGEEEADSTPYLPYTTTSPILFGGSLPTPAVKAYPGSDAAGVQEAEDPPADPPRLAAYLRDALRGEDSDAEIGADDGALSDNDYGSVLRAFERDTRERAAGEGEVGGGGEAEQLTLRGFDLEKAGESLKYAYGRVIQEQLGKESALMKQLSSSYGTAVSGGSFTIPLHTSYTWRGEPISAAEFARRMAGEDPSK